jgi:23S rRNA (uracil1939-C5)-methyltransferase
VREAVPNIKGQVLEFADDGRRRRWTDGEPVLTESVDGLLLRISDGAFAQANWKLNPSLVKTVTTWALNGHQQQSYPGAQTRPAERLRVLELYAGIGNLSLPLARKGAWVTMVEGNRAAVADARENARMNHLAGCRFRMESAETFLAASSPGEYDLALLNPPRVGLSKDALDHLIKVNPKRILYLSCDPPTLARDLRVLHESGYGVARLQGYDMFPQTRHIETLVELIAKPSGFGH